MKGNSYKSLMAALSATVLQMAFPVSVDAQDTLTVSRVTASAKPSSTIHSAPVQAVSRDDFEKKGYNDVFEAVRTFSGINVKDYGGIGGIKTVSVRSLGAQHTAVSYDGVVVSNMQSGEVDLGQFSLDNVSMIFLEIGQGDNIFRPARMLASAGTVEIQTAEPAFDSCRRFNAALRLNAASFGTYNPAAVIEGELSDNWSLSLNADYMKSEGAYPFSLKNGNTVEEHVRTNSDVTRLRGEINLYGRLGRGRLSVKGNWLDSERGLPGSVVLYNDKADERLWDRNRSLGASYRTGMGERFEFLENVKYSYAWNRYFDRNEKYAGGVEDDRYTQQEYYESSVLLFKPVKSLSFSLAEDLFFGKLDSDIPECRFPRRWTSLTALCGKYTSDRLTVAASLLGTFITENVSSGIVAPDRKKISPAVSLIYKVFPESNLRLRMSYKNGYRVPTFNDLYYFRVGNVSLKPETADQFNVGLTWAGRGRFTIDGYYYNVKDKIVAVPTLFIWKMQNVGRASILGMDANAERDFNLGGRMALSVKGSYSYQYAVDVTDPESQTYGHQLAYTPRNSGNASLLWTSPWLNVSYSVIAVGKRFAQSENIKSNLIEGYMDHSLSVSREFSIGKVRLRIQGEALNLADVNYMVIKYYPMPGRSFRFTTTMKF